MKVLSLFGILILLVICAMPALPQASTSTVRGTVRDTTEAVIPAAKVTLLNTETNVARETTANDVGLYVFPGVIPGAYRISVEVPGMQKFEATFTAMVQRDTTVDAVMAPATSTTTVEVRDMTALVTTDSAALGTTIENQRISQLPINGRNYLQLLQTVPGVDQGAVISGNRVSQSSIVQAYGYRTNTAQALYDGVSRNETYEGWDFLRPPGLDAIAEVRTETNSASAKFATPLAIVMSSKSGTNEVHGAVFYTNRNSGYGVARRRQDTYVKPPYLNRHEYGASLGGPVYIPKVYDGRNRTFFFFAYEGERLVGGSTSEFKVPTQAMRNGDFSGLIDNQGRQTNIYNPYTTNPTTWGREQFSYNNKLNVIDPALQSPMAKYLIGLRQLPTLPNVNPLISNNWRGPLATKEQSSTKSLRLDHRISDKDLIFGRIGWDTYWREYFSGQPDTALLFGTTHQNGPQKSAMVTWLHTFSPSMTNEVMASVSRQAYNRGMGDFKTNYAAQMGLPNPFGAINLPDINAGLDRWRTSAPFFQYTNYWSLQDNATKIMGKHELQFGAHGRYEQMDLLPGAASAGGETFSTLATALWDGKSQASPKATPFTGYDFANFYLGVGNYSATFRRPWVHLRRPEIAPYFNDNWKVTSRLTLNLGLRYEIRPPIYDRNGTLLGFDLNKAAYVIGMPLDEFQKRNFTLPSIMNALQSYGGKVITNEEAGLPSKMMYNNWKKFGPRLGVAYKATSGDRPLVIRSGLRVSYYAQKLQDMMGAQWGSAPVSASFQYSRTSAQYSPDGRANYGLRSTPTCVAGVNAATGCIDVNNASSLKPGSFPVSVEDPYHTDGRVMDWNFTLEKEVASNMVARVGYVGNWSTNQQTFVSYNDQTPEYIWYATKGTELPSGTYAGTATRGYNQTVYGDVNFFTPLGFAKNKTFQFELQRRFSKGLGFQVFYVLGKTMLTNRDTDDTQDGETIRALNYYLPGTVPTDRDARNRLLNYKLDDASPLHRLSWNVIADLPFGRGKKFGGNANSFLNKVIGGWQIAGIGSINSTRFSLPTNNWIVDKNIQVYGYNNPIQDCTSGTCYPGYLYWNGYISSNLINRVDSTGKCTGICGVPSNYKPAARPMIPYGQTTLPANAPSDTDITDYWDTNHVWVTPGLHADYEDNLNPWRNQYVAGPRQWFMDASLFKTVQIGERAAVRFNIDMFNVLNNPNNPTSVSDSGIINTFNSGSPARVTQLTLRLTW